VNVNHLLHNSAKPTFQQSLLADGDQLDIYRNKILKIIGSVVQRFTNLFLVTFETVRHNNNLSLFLILHLYLNKNFVCKRYFEIVGIVLKL
jgi:hypothetical protein